MRKTIDIENAARLLLDGRLVAIPTETVYGLAARADDDEAIARVFEAKGRPLNHPLILHIASAWPVTRYTTLIPDYATTLMKAFWPGPLTLVFKANMREVSATITGGFDTVAIRCPNHPVAQALLSQVNIPLVAPSANAYEKVSPTTAEHVLEGFEGKDIHVLEGGRCTLGIESTIVDATHPNHYAILRHGVVSQTAIQQVLPDVLCVNESTVQAPGKAKRHYQPQKPLLCFDNQDALIAYARAYGGLVLSFSSWQEASITPFFIFDADPLKASHEFYYQLRRADKADGAQILIDIPPDTPEWQAIRERILKARR